ncbi:MAG: V-type ATPase subunit [Candidatus Altiarchaeota archaeon]|nr:V-type ATPase subunit [Candidatus Altiarchaeota archaeon]
MTMADYAYSNTRVRVMKSSLLKNSDLEALIQAKDLQEYLTSLRQTPYVETLSGLDKVTLREMEKYFSRDLIRTIDKVIRISPPDCVPFLSAISQKYEFEYLKFILNSKMGGLSTGEIRNRIPLAELDHLFSYRHTEGFLSGLIDLPVEDVPALLRGRYPGLTEFMPDSQDSLDTLIALDRYYFSGLLNAAGSLNRGDKKIVSMLISAEVDITNILIILRSINHGYDVRRFIIPSQNPHINELCGHTPSSVMEVLTKLSKTVYGPLLEDAASSYTQTNSLLQMELTLRRYLVKKSKILMKEYPFKIGFILGFLKLKEPEIENLKAICVGIDEGLPADKIRELLLISS